MKKNLFAACLFALFMPEMAAQSQRSVELLNDDWKFALGDASNPLNDFKSGTEYFNYLTKANSIHNEGPYAAKFNDSLWTTVKLPHDWAVQLPYDAKASHSHGYRALGYQYPQNSVGWYRKIFRVDKADEGKHFTLQFDGIFRNATLWVNGFYMGVEPSGYATQVYDITDYLNYGGDNLITVRADASLEEGWFYEGAGIYRDVWLCKSAPVHVAPMGTFIHADLNSGYTEAEITAETEVENSGLESNECTVNQYLIDADGKRVAQSGGIELQLKAKEKKKVVQTFALSHPKLWYLQNPYLYKVETEVVCNGNCVDTYYTSIGLREIQFDAKQGFFLNGENIKLKGVNMHQDHAGVGAAIPTALQAYRIKQLKSFGCNAYRASHNPMTPALLDICDREGILVIEENRLMGVNDAQISLLERMIKRDRNHPCIILWSDGNEEWGLENTIQGRKVAATMREYTHRFDPTRLATAANAGGVEMIKALDVVGYNYLAQNNIDALHKEFPNRIAMGSEETSGCGTRGVYFKEDASGRMPSINRAGRDGVYNVIERGWRFYEERPWLSGLFYWTGFDYRGEPNPLKYPAVGSQFGLLDYCGFYKDETYYLKAWWTDDPVLHVFPHWNLQGHEGETIPVWVYSNCETVELFVNGKSAGKQQMPKNGYLNWNVVYRPGSVKAVGYKQGKRMETAIYTTGSAEQIALSVDRTDLKADNQDVAVVTIELRDKKNRFVPTANDEVTICLTGSARILGVGNGDSAFKDAEHPDELNCKLFKVKAFNGLAQVLIQSTYEGGEVQIRCESGGMKPGRCLLKSIK